MDSQSTSATVAAPPVPQPVLPQYVEADCPPPSYEEIMGHQILTTAKAQTPQADLPTLSYIDIMPRCLNPGNIRQRLCPQFDQFSVLIEAANQWLTTNNKLTVWKCETVERKVTAGPLGEVVIEMDKMIFTETAFGFNVYVRGLRMWLKIKEPNEPIQQLGLRDIVPDKLVIHPAMLHGGYYGPGYFYMQNPFFMQRPGTTFVTFEGLSRTFEKLNRTLKDNPLPGKVLSVETSSHKSVEGMFSQFDLDPDKTCWYEDGSKTVKRFTQVIRVFYVIGQPAHEEICMEDFIPAVTLPGNVMRSSQFENWSSLVSRTATWIPNQKGIRVVSLQTCTAKYTSFMGETNIQSDSTDDVDFGKIDSRLVKIMRVFFVKSAASVAPPLTHPLSCRTFLPVRLGRTEYESMPQTMHRIEAWLKVTGMPVYSVETSHCLFNMHRQSGVEQDKSTFYVQGFTGNKYVTAITVYFPYPFQEPHPSYLPPAPVYDMNNNNAVSGSCEIL